jgi:tripartite-type tricarboxylate transporter receptor subunit TctC
MTRHSAGGIRRRLALTAIAVATVASAGLPSLAQAQAFPSRPIRLIVPNPPGGATDVMARTLAKVMQEQSNAPVIVDNRVGASGSIGVMATVNAPPDGYTIMLTLADATTIYPLLKKTPPYLVEKDLTPIAQVAFTNVLFAVSDTSPYRTVKDVVDASRTKKMNYGSNGFGTTAHLWIELFKAKTGANMLHVPYKGAAPSLQALIGGEHDFLVASPASLKVQLDAGRVRPIAATSAKRLPQFPNVPTMAESGYPDFVVGAWFGVFGPPHLPAPIADKLHAMIVSAMKSPEYQKHADTFMFDTQPVARAEFAKLVAADAAVWRAAIAAAKIEPVE